MANEAQPVERLRQFLRELSPEARALLITELERGVLRGEEVPGGDLVLQEVRRAVRESGQHAPRIGTPARQFFHPIEPFLVDDRSVSKHRIARASLEPIWDWICRDLAPAEAKAYCDRVTGTLIADQTSASGQLTRNFQDEVAARIQKELVASRSDEKARRRLAGQIGTQRGIDDAHDLLRILQARDALSVLADRIPPHIQNLSGPQLDAVKAALDVFSVQQSNARQYALILLMTRLAAPWQLIRIAIKAADSDDATRIAGSPYVAAVEIVLTEIERMVAELKADLKRGSEALVSVLKWIHDAVRGLRTELDLTADSPWGRQLAAIRGEISKVLKAEIESIPGRVRRLLRPRPAGEIVAGVPLDATEVAETEAAVEFVGACRMFAGELAISEMTQRTCGDVQQFLDTGTQALLDGLRHANGSDRAFRQSQVDAAVRICAKMFGREYASLLTKAAEVAANGERRAAVKA